MKKYIVDEKELEEFIKESHRLNALDNREWYGEALEEYDEGGDKE